MVSLDCLLEVVGVGLVVMMSVWTGHFMGGFAGQSDPKLEFNWHPLLLTISLIYLYGNGILIYRLARNERKSKLKVAHATVMGSATVLACFGIKAGLDSNTKYWIENLKCNFSFKMKNILNEKCF